MVLEQDHGNEKLAGLCLHLFTDSAGREAAGGFFLGFRLVGERFVMENGRRRRTRSGQRDRASAETHGNEHTSG